MSLAAIELSIETGLRKDELLHQLVWPDVQIGRRPEFAVRGKGDKVRRVPLTPRALEIVTALPIPTKRPNDVGHLIICRENGRPYGDMDKALAEACKRAKIPDFTWHDLRRTCGCRLLQDRRFQMVQVRDWMGHESVETTERHYAFLRVEDLHLALERSEDEKAAAPSAEVLPLRRRKT